MLPDEQAVHVHLSDLTIVKYISLELVVTIII